MNYLVNFQPVQLPFSGQFSTGVNIVGDFSRAAVGLFEDCTLITQKVNYLEGEMAITAIINAKALLPHAQTNLLPFWTVS